VSILLQPIVHTHLSLLILQSPSQNKRTSLHQKKNQYLYFSSKRAFLLGPNILDLLVTSPTNLLDLLPTNLSHPHYPSSIRESTLNSQPSKSLRNLASVQPPKFTCKEKKNKQHIETQNMLIPIPFESAPSIATYFGTFHAFHQLKKIIHVRFSSMIYATFTQRMFSCYILISPFPQECHGRKMLGKFVIF